MKKKFIWFVLFLSGFDFTEIFGFRWFSFSFCCGNSEHRPDFVFFFFVSLVVLLPARE
jgi:hypothetical protein